MANIAGATNALPGVYDIITTQSSGVAIPGGSRVVAMIGQGTTPETLVSQAQGGGLDGLNPTYTSSAGSDGRHFALANFPLVSNRTTLYLNGEPLTLLELGPITPTTTFPQIYQAQLDPTTGHILLQSAYILNQGGANYVPLTTNVGLGSLNALQLVDQNDPPETWTIRCISVQRNAMNQPIGGTAQFEAFGTVSGSPLDANGNPIIWVANGQVVSNGILSFSITETTVSSVVVSPFVPGDGFTIIIKSGVLVRGDSLTSVEIPVNNINNPTLTQGMSDVVAFCGSPSLTDNLSLGAQLCYANGASSMIAVQAAPPLPRRTSYVLDPSVNAMSTEVDDFIFPFPLLVHPDINSDIHVFATNPATGVETQLPPNKYPFYTSISTPQNPIAGVPSEAEFIFSTYQPPSGYSYGYSVISGYEVVFNQFDGYVGRLPAYTNQAVFSSASIEFDDTYVGLVLNIIDSNLSPPATNPANKANIGTFNITGVSNGQLIIQTITTGEPGDPVPYESPSGFPDFTSQTSVTFELIQISTGLPVAGGSGVDGTLAATFNQATAAFTDSEVSFATIFGSIPANQLSSYFRLQINGSTVGNNGLYDITGWNGGDQLTITMAFVSETGLTYEVWNTQATGTTSYLVLNQNIIPQGNQLRVTIVDARDAAFYDAGWINALASLETVECDIVVPLPNQTISVIFQNALNHCITMSNVLNRKERVLFIGAINGLTPANLTGQTLADVEDLGILEGIPENDPTSTLAGNIQDLANYSVAAAYGDTYRCVYFYPDQIVVQAGANNVLIDGFYLAAAGAGFANADLAIQDPFTNKVFSGFAILANNTYSNLVLQQLAAAGVCTLSPVSGGGNVVWGITTSQSGFPEEQEISIVFIRDRVAKVLRSGFSGFIGTAQTPNTASQLNTEAVVLLNSLVTQGLITTYTGLTVVQDQVDPRQWDISVSISPTYPINWVYIQVTIGNLGT
jgi:hypothetical protein